MRTRTSPPGSVTRSEARKAADLQIWNRPKITLVSTCPNCGRERPQYGYTRRDLSNLLNAHRKIDAYCIECNVCWPITESERRSISPQ
jgi:hypothetical protein